MMDDDDDLDFLFNATDFPTINPSSTPTLAPFSLQDNSTNELEQAAALAVDEAKRARARVYRQRYKKKQAEKKLETEKKLEETSKELAEIQKEQEILLAHNTALNALVGYSSAMLNSLRSSLQSLGNNAIHNASLLQDWARHQWLLLPNAMELLFANIWEPSEDNMRMLAKFAKPEEMSKKHENFINRIAVLLEEVRSI